MLFSYMNIDKFTDLCDSSALTFVNPLKCWSDKREGPLFRSLIRAQCWTHAKDDPISIQSEIEHIVLKQGIHVFGLFLTKRKAEFAYEQEVNEIEVILSKNDKDHKKMSTHQHFLCRKC